MMIWNRRHQGWLIAVVYLLGVMDLALVLSFVSDEVFLSGDGGIKTLMIKQYLTNGWNTGFLLDGSSEIVELWNQGLYPFGEPFIYRRESGWVSAFPPYYALLNTPLFMAFGYKGLYVIPALSLILLWGLFIRLANRLELEDGIRAIGFAFLVFGSSLTIYGGIFWEHALATLCSFVGLSFIVENKLRVVRSVQVAFFSGLIAGFALWLRPESISMLFMYALLNLRGAFRRDDKAVFFLLGLGLTAVGFFLANYVFLGELTGVHSRQITDDFNLFRHIGKALHIFVVLCAKAFLYDPVWIMIVVLAGLYLYRQGLRSCSGAGGLAGIACRLVFIVVFYYLTIIWILPNTGGYNWGIRYSLLAAPVGSLLFMILYQLSKGWLRPSWAWSVIIIFLMFGFYQNVIRANEFVYNNYRGEKLAVLRYLKENPVSVLLLSNQNLSAEFEALMPETEFLLTNVDAKYKKFADSRFSQDKDYALLYQEPDGRALETLTNKTLSRFSAEKSFGQLKLMKSTLMDDKDR